MAYVTEQSLNEVQAFNETTGALVGTPITVGTGPIGIGYWRPATSSSQDPEVVATNSGSHSVTVIDAVTRTVVATVNVPGGSAAVAVAGSPTEPYAAVVDTLSGKVSIINLSNNTDAGEITLTSTASVLTSVAFSASGAYAYVTDPSQHKIFVLDYTGGSAPYYALASTYTNSSYDFSSIASDMSTTSSGSFFVTDAQSSGKLLKFTVASTLSAPTVVKTFTSQTPGAVSVNPGASTAWVALTGTKTVDAVTVATGSATNYTVNSAFSAVGPLALSADGSTLMTADTGSGTVQETTATSGVASNSTSTDAVVSQIAPALATPGAWNAYVTAGSYVDVVNTSTQSLAQQIADTNGPKGVAVSPDGQFVYVANSSTASVSVIATSLVGSTTNPVIHTWAIAQGSQPNVPTPTTIAVNPQGTSLLVGDSANGAALVVDTNQADANYGHVVDTIGLAGSGTHSTLTPQGVAFGPDGTYGYVTVTSSTSSNDGVTVLAVGSSTSAGYTFSHWDHAIAQGSDTMWAPSQIVINPNGEYAYVNGVYGTGSPPASVFTFPIATDGELSTGSGTPVGIGFNTAGLAYSPEIQSALATSTTSYELSSISEAYGTTNYTSSTSNLPGNLAVSPDGLYVAVAEQKFCGSGQNELELFDAASGGGNDVLLGTSPPSYVAFAPQAAPQAVPTSEMVGNASNPSESAIASGMNDVVSSGTPSDAPGASAGVDTATGAYSLSLDSMDVPDIGIGLTQSATYDSQMAGTSGLLGYGWTYSYGITATQNSHSASTNPCAIVVTQENGSTVTFFPSAEGPYSTCPAAGYVARGWAQATMTFAASCNGSDSCYVLTRGATMQYYIDETTGQLVKIVDLHGNTVTISWGAHSACSGATSTEPCVVTAADGTRTLTYSYPSAGSGTCPSSATSCVVVTDPIGRTLTYAKNSSGQLASASLANGTVTATYVFSYNSSSQMTAWWDPQNNANHSGSTSYATDVTWTSGKVTQVTGPTMTDAGTSMTSTYVPTTTFAYTGFAGSTSGAVGDGTVLVANPDFNQSPYMAGANLTLDTYAGYQLVSSTQGYGALGTYESGTGYTYCPNANQLLCPSPSESATPMRDDYNLMPSESMNALAGAWVGPVVSGQASEYDTGINITTYDANGNVLQSLDPLGHTTTNQYNGLNEVTVSVDPIGNTSGASSTVIAAHTTTNTYDAAGDLTSTTSPATEDWLSNPKTSSYFNSNGTLCATRTADEVATYGVLSSCSSSHATTYAYDSSGDQTSSTDPLGNVTESAYDVNGDVCASLTPNGYAASYSLTSCPSTGEPYETVTLARSLYLQPTQSVSPTNASGGTSWTYFDLNDNQIASVSVLGNPSSCNPLTTSTCTYTSYSTIDAMGNKVSDTSPTATSGTQGPTTTTYFDPTSTQVASVSPAGNASGSPSSYEQATVSDNLGDSVASTTASQLGLSTCSVTSTSSPCPNTTVSTFDPLSEGTGSVTAKGGETGSTTVATAATFNPDSTGANTSAPTTSGGTATTASAYDANGNQLESTTTAPSTTTTGTTTTYEPDGKACWSSPLAWSGSGNPSCDSPPTSSGNMTTVDYYDSSGQLVAVSGPGSNPYATGNTGGCNPLTTSTCSYTTYYTYDEDGHQLTATQPTDYLGNYPVTTSYYDANGNVIAVTGPAGSPGTCNPVTTSTCTDTTYTTYDAANRVLTKTYTDGTPTVTYTYNNDGTRNTMVDGTGTTSYSYDSVGRLTSKTDGAGNTVSYGYDTGGQLICMSYPNSASDTCATSGAGTSSPPNGDITYTYDSQGRMSSIVTWTGVTLMYAYDCAGNVAWLSTGTTIGTPCTGSTPAPLGIPSTTSAVTTQYGYTADQETSIATTTNDGATNLLSFTITRDGNGNVLTSVPKVNSTTMNTDTYTYDSTSRVASGPITGSTGSTSYGYNTADGITADTTAFNNASYSQNGELCWTASTTGSSCSSAPSSSTAYTYDPSGDRLTVTPPSGGANEALGWNQASEELTCVNTSGTTCSTSSPTSTTTAYTYNGDGLRATSAFGASGTNTTFTWDGQKQRLVSDGTADYVYGPNPTLPIMQLIASGSSTAEDLLVEDSNQNARGVVQVAGSISSYNDTLVNYVDFNAFGQPITESGGSSAPGGLTSQVGSYTYSVSPIGYGASYLDQSGMPYLIHRYLDPPTGQFLSIDPLLQQTLQPYSYAADNPVSGSDPSGLKVWVDPTNSTEYGQNDYFQYDCNFMKAIASAKCIEGQLRSEWKATAANLNCEWMGLPHTDCYVTFGRTATMKVEHKLAQHEDYGIVIATIFGVVLGSLCAPLIAAAEFEGPLVVPITLVCSIVVGSIAAIRESDMSKAAHSAANNHACLDLGRTSKTWLPSAWATRGDMCDWYL